MRTSIRLSIAAAAIAGVLCAQAKRPFTVVEATIPEMRAAMEQHRVTSRDLVVQYLTRIALYENKLHAIITVNPNALQEADERDCELPNVACAVRCTAFRSRSRTTS